MRGHDVIQILVTLIAFVFVAGIAGYLLGFESGFREGAKRARFYKDLAAGKYD